MGGKVGVHRPTGRKRRIARGGGASVGGSSWEAMGIGLIDNGKPGAAALLTGVADALQVEHERRTVVVKQIASSPMNDDQFGVIREHCQAAILAVGN